MKEENYTPINCDFYDQLEIYAVQKKNLEIHYKNKNGIRETVKTKIKNLQTKEKSEYLITDKDLWIRMDRIERIDIIE